MTAHLQPSPAPSTACPTVLESLRAEQRIEPGAPHTPTWRFIPAADERFLWLADGERGVLLIDQKLCSFELRCHGPHTPCPPMTLPTYYHHVTYEGVRVIERWRLPGEYETSAFETWTDDGVAGYRRCMRWPHGSTSETHVRVYYDQDWGAYMVDVRTSVDAHQVNERVEYANVLPARVGETRPAREALPYVLWHHPDDGLRCMGKNPLWWNTTEAQDTSGARRISPGGFLAYGPDDQLNPVFELLDSEPATGAATCDALQDEHILVDTPGARQQASGWTRLSAHYRVFSMPRTLSDHVLRASDPLRDRTLLAWKFKHGAVRPHLPADLTELALPGSPFYGRADWSQPVSWDEPFAGRLWMPAPNRDAPIYYDRETGRTRPGSIRLRADGLRRALSPNSGHSLHITEGQTYRFTIWAKTSGAARAWIEAWETLFSTGDGTHHHSDAATGDEWTELSITLTGPGDAAPFLETVLCADGEGDAWFTDMAFEPIDSNPAP